LLWFGVELTHHAQDEHPAYNKSQAYSQSPTVSNSSQLTPEKYMSLLEQKRK